MAIGNCELEHRLCQIDGNGCSVLVGPISTDEDLIPTPMKTGAPMWRKQSVESFPSFVASNTSSTMGWTSSDNPAWTEEMLGPLVIKRGRGPQATSTKVLTSIRLDADVLEFFMSQGEAYRSRINEVLRREIKRSLRVVQTRHLASALRLDFDIGSRISHAPA